MIYEFTLSANEIGAPLPGGYRVEILETTQPIDVEIRTENGGKIEKADNAPASWYWQQPVWTKIPEAAQVQLIAGPNGATGRISISGGNSGINSVTGVVEVTNADKKRTLDGKAFLQSAASAAVSAEFSFAGLINPTGSGRDVFVNRLILQPRASANCKFGLITDVAALIAHVDTANYANLGSGGSKYVDGAASSAEVIKWTNATGLDSGWGSGRTVLYGVTEPYDYRYTEPYLIPEGMGIYALCQLVNTEIRITPEWFEDAS